MTLKMTNNPSPFEVALKNTQAVVKWSVGVNSLVARILRVRDLIQEDFMRHGHMREPVRLPLGLADLDKEVSIFETINLQPVSPVTPEDQS